CLVQPMACPPRIVITVWAALYHHGRGGQVPVAVPAVNRHRKWRWTVRYASAAGWRAPHKKKHAAPKENLRMYKQVSAFTTRRLFTAIALLAGGLVSFQSPAQTASATRTSLAEPTAVED